MGTCAGMIMLSSNKKNSLLDPLSLMDFTVKRNGWGSQINSFKDKVKLILDLKKDFIGYFIRAPKIIDIGTNIQILAKYKNYPVMLTDGMHFVCSFHPEVGFDNRIHKYFIDAIKN